MKFIQTKLKDLIVVEPKIFGDNRGKFFESFNEKNYIECIPYTFVQDNFSKSTKNVLRGLHFQKQNPQGKLVTVISGKVIDVALDLRLNSDTFGCYEKFILSDENNRQVFIPPGFAHGFGVLSDNAIFHYKCTEFYDPADECGIIWNDKTLNIDWKIKKPVISNKDEVLMSMDEYLNEIGK